MQAEKESVVDRRARRDARSDELNDLLRRLMHAFEDAPRPAEGKDHAQTQE